MKRWIRILAVLICASLLTGIPAFADEPVSAPMEAENVIEPSEESALNMDAEENNGANFPSESEPQTVKESAEISESAPKPEQISSEAAQISPEAEQISSETAQISPEAAQISSETAQISPEAAQISSEAAQISPEPAQISSEAALISLEAAQASPDVTLTLDRVTAVMYVGDGGLTLKAAFSDGKTENADGTPRIVTYTSSSTKYATVNAEGRVTGKKRGTAVITATANVEGAEKSATCTVKIAKKPSKVGIKLTSAELMVGETAAAAPTFASGYGSTVTYATADAGIVEIDEYGNMRANAKGAGKVKVTTKNGKSAIASVKVYAYAEEVHFAEEKLLLGVKMTRKPEPVFREYEKDNYTYELDPAAECVELDADGTLRAVKAGTATLKVRTEENGCEATCEIEVLPEPTELNAPSSLTMGKGDKINLLTSGLVTVGEGEYCGNFTFSTSKSKCVSADANGNLTAKGTGTANITVRTYNSGKKTIRVTVRSLPKSVSVNPKTLNLGADMTGKVSVSFPKNTYSIYTFESSRPELLTVDASGNLRVSAEIIEPTTATVTVRTYNGRTAACAVNLYPAPQTVEAETEKIILGENEPDVYVKGVYPDGTMCAFRYESDDESTVLADAETGLLTALKRGTARISIIARNNEAARAYADVEVLPQPTELNAPSSLTLGKGDKINLLTSGLVTVGEGEYCGKYSFSTSKSKYAAVDANGNLTAKGTGTANITVRTYNGGKRTIRVTVRSLPKSVSISPKTLNLGADMTGKVSVSFPKNTYSLYVFESSRPDLLTVDASGNLRVSAEIIEPTLATVTARTYNGRTAACAVNLYPAPQSVDMAETALTMGVGEPKRNVTGVYPDGTMCAFRYESDDESVARVDPVTGSLEAVGTGDAVITAYANNSSAKATCAVTVVPEPAKLTLRETTVSLGKGDKLDLKSLITLEPQYSCAAFGYKSSKTKYATVSADGIITGKAKGTATVTVSAYNGVSAPITVKVYNAPKSVSVTKSLKLWEGGSARLQVTFPSGTYSVYAFEGYDPELISVSEDGTVTAAERIDAPTSTTITVRTKNGRTAKCAVEVMKAPQSVRFTEKPELIAAGECTPLKIELLPEGAHDALTYTSSNPQVAEIGADGSLRPLAEGWTEITATTVNGISDAFTVEVCAYGKLHPPMTVAHRGASKACPPGNTLAAFRKAMELGADMVELDVQKTKDGRILVRHDTTIRLPNGKTGKIADLTLKQIQSLESYACTLDEALACLSSGDAIIQIEFKVSGIESKVLQIAREKGVYDRVLCGSFNTGVLNKCRSLDPNMPTVYILNTAGNLKNVVEKSANYKYETISVKSGMLTAQNVLKMHLSGKQVLAWTVNDAKEIARLRQIGVDGIITDDPTLV